MSTYSVIVPTLEEEENIPILIFLLFEEANKHQLDIEAVVVDDNSKDKTRQKVENMQKVYGNKLKLLKRPKKMGLGTAYVDGLAQTRDSDFIVIMDADLSHHPKYLIQFIKKQQQTQCDIVYGTRYEPTGGVYGWDLKRKIISRGANYLAQLALDIDFTDATGSYRIYRKTLISKIIKDVKSKGYAFQMEILVRAQKENAKIESVPIVFVDRVYGYSKLGPNELSIYLQGIWSLMRIF